MEEQKTHRLWVPVEFSQEWLQCDTSTIDDISPSWFDRREILQTNSKEYQEFITELKREHALRPEL